MSNILYISDLHVDKDKVLKNSTVMIAEVKALLLEIAAGKQQISAPSPHNFRKPSANGEKGSISLHSDYYDQIWPKLDIHVLSGFRYNTAGQVTIKELRMNIAN